jgi:hypothetical protein
MDNRCDDLARFYDLMNLLEDQVGGRRALGACDGKLSWPTRGVYFFLQPGEYRDSHNGPGRIVRLGTHALKAGSKSTLWGRLSQHRGKAGGTGGNHRGSIFRLLIGDSLMRSGQHQTLPSWGLKGDLGKAAIALNQDRSELKEAELSLEIAVSKYLGEMQVLWLDIDDEPAPASHRGIVERNAIALLSNYSQQVIDSASSSWLGSHCSRDRVQRSHLWNNNHVDEPYHASFLDLLENRIKAT